MRIERRAIGLTTAALLFAVAAGCADSDDNADPTSSPTVTPSPTSPTSTSSTAPNSTPPSDSQVASDAAASAVRKYYTVLDDVRQHANKPLSALRAVATSTQLSAEQHLIQTERSQGLREIGNTQVDHLKVQTVNLDNSDPAAGKVPVVTIDVCWDVSKADLVDKNGKSVVSSKRADRGWTRYTVTNYHWSKNQAGGWRVASGQDLKKTPCAAS